MNVKIVRTETTSQGTFGILYLDDKEFCRTGELPVLAGKAEILNERQTDCIPVGTYKCEIVNSPKFGKVYTVKDVPNRSHILIHSGNYCGDIKKGYKSNVEGCIILGNRVGILDRQRAIIESKLALTKFMSLLGDEVFELEICEEF